MRADMTALTVTEGDDHQFYPTPDDVAGKMLAGIDWSYIQNILEPSAGNGNLVLAAIKAHAANTRRDSPLAIDCIEIDPYLRAILKQNAEVEWVRPLHERRKYIDDLPYEERRPFLEELSDVRSKLSALDTATVNIIHDNFLTYHGWRQYQLIIMNPPFAEGDLHLLKALELQKDGGSIACLLNAETIRNPYTGTRQILQRELNKYGAQIKFVKDAFRDAERRADVDVAIVRITIPTREEKKSDIWERMDKAAREEQPEFAEVTDLVIGDFVEQAVMRFRVEVSSCKELIRQYYALRPYMTEELDPTSIYGKKSILTLTVGQETNYEQLVNVDKLLKAIRLKYWRALFKNEKFIGRLTSAVRERYMQKVDDMAEYDFTLFNIRTIMAEMGAQVVDGVKGAILSLFDTLTAEHSWYPECNRNKHYFNGWAANKAHKIGKKSIIPTYGMFATHSWNHDTFEVNNAYKVLSDIEKVFDYLSGAMTDEHDILERLKIANANGKTRNIPLKYFDVDLYKKGTTHIKYRDMDLIDKMNIYAARNKNWLPPNYGRTTYSEMTTEEKEVVESFQGAEAYAKVMARSDFFLSEPTRSVAMLTDGSEGGAMR